MVISLGVMNTAITAISSKLADKEQVAKKPNLARILTAITARVVGP
jgi:hypothetical protein